ncbi:MAG TPA: TadE/TadG family type IV pilus assembly protein [Acidimicrobiales bacterium]|nr:TadE/TadG family type IV pilus assembly protein [Acidimicrobiales bacterium]
MRSRGVSRYGGHSGSLTIELTVLTPVVVMFVLLALALGRFELAREQVVGAARAAAEAAAVAPSAAGAQAAAVAAAQPVVARQVHSCTQLNVSTDTSQFAPGGDVKVTVSCDIDYADLSIPGIPGHTAVRVMESAPIDPFRVVQ